MKWIYLSPHLDDAAYSCGGLIFDQIRSGVDVEVWTICAGDPPEGGYSLFAQVHHKIWGLTAQEAVKARREEDAKALKILGVQGRYFDVPDAIYRKNPKTGEQLYTNGEALFGGLEAGDEALVRRLALLLARDIPQTAVVVSPLTVGNHVDHQLVRAVAERLERPIQYFPDFPYTREHAGAIDALVSPGMERISTSISKPGMTAWQESIAAYQSQISTFWDSVDQMRVDIQKHAEKFGGTALWRATGS
jgi:LmbE family N-acetylglucosaminyl deacetylase